MDFIDLQLKSGKPIKPIDRSDVEWVTGILKSHGFEVTNITFTAPWDYAFLTVAYDYPREFTDTDDRKFIVGPYHPKSKTWKPTKKVLHITLNHSTMRRKGEEEWRNHISLDWSLLGDVWRFGRRSPIVLDLPAGMHHIYDFANSIQELPDFEANVAMLAKYLKGGKALPIPENHIK